MKEVSIIIPNYNGIEVLEPCLNALRTQTCTDFEVLLVDNGSTDGSLELVRAHYPEVQLLELDRNYGFCRAINEGVSHTSSPYVIFLNNDTEVFPDFVYELLAGMRRHPKAFSGGAMMLQMKDHQLIDDAGNYYSALGWAYARGKDKTAEDFQTEMPVFSTCAGAAIYRRRFLKKTGLLDEAHFAYLEDLDLGYRARILGYENWYLPKAKVYHMGSASSGSRYNAFKTRYSARNNIYVVWKNMPVGQQILNAPLLLAGFAVKAAFFQKKGLGKTYTDGLREGWKMAAQPENRGKKVPFRKENLGNYAKIQVELWQNILRRF